MRSPHRRARSDLPSRSASRESAAPGREGPLEARSSSCAVERAFAVPPRLDAFSGRSFETPSETSETFAGPLITRKRVQRSSFKYCPDEALEAPEACV